MNKKTQKAIAASKDRLVYYLTADEAALIDEFRIRHHRRKDEVLRDNLPRCKYCVSQRVAYLYPAKKDGYCGSHWRMITRWGYDPATYSYERDGHGPPPTIYPAGT